MILGKDVFARSKLTGRAALDAKVGFRRGGWDSVDAEVRLQALARGLP